MNIEIPADLNPFVRQSILRGDYQNENELLIAGVHLLQAQNQLRSDVNNGIDQLERGLGHDGELVLARLEERARQLAAKGTL